LEEFKVRIFILTGLLILKLIGADHDLYDKSLSVTGHYSFNEYDMDIKDSWGWGFRFNANQSTYNIWDIGAYQFSFDYTTESDYISIPSVKSNIYRIGGNLLWYFDNDSQMTPFALIGVGIEFWRTRKIDFDNGIFGTLGKVGFEVSGQREILL